MRRAVWTCVLALLAYLCFWPIAVNPVPWRVTLDAGHEGVHARNDKLAQLSLLPLNAGQSGPEFILAHAGKLYTGLAHGEVLELSLDGQHRTLVANTGGRPLGLDVDAQGRLLVADGLLGLLRITGRGAQAQVETLLTEVAQPEAHDPIRFADAVKVAPDGRIWLTDASRRFGAKVWGGTFEASVLDILEHSCTGRLVRTEADGSQGEAVLDGLCFPNGLVFSSDGKSALVSETGTYRILKIDVAGLDGLRAEVQRSDKGRVVPTLAQALQRGVAKVLVDNLPGFPDNLSVGQQGRIWVGLTKPRSRVVDVAAAHPWIRSMTLRLPRALWPVPKPYGHLIAFDESGKVLDDLQDPLGAYPETTSATEVDGKLFVQSLHADSIAWRPYSGPTPAAAAR